MYCTILYGEKYLLEMNLFQDHCTEWKDTTLLATHELLHESTRGLVTREESMEH
jgi:hypothetical protein